MRTPSTRIILAAAIILLVLGTVGAKAAIHTFGKDGVFKREIQKVLACTDEKNAIICTLPSIRHMLDKGSAVDVMSALEKNLEPRQCHYVGHVVGQQMYVRMHDVEAALNECNRLCDSSCIHGIIGEAFAEQLGFGDPSESQNVDLGHIDMSELKKIGAKLCSSSETCHGIGHTIFQVTKEMESSMAFCRNIAPSRSLVPCYNGASMEYADILSARNMRAVSGVKIPTAASLHSFCILGSLSEDRACFRYFQRFVMATLEPLGYSKKDAITETRKICLAYPPGDFRIACLSGIGSYYSYYILTDQSSAQQICDQFPKAPDKAACVLGEVFVAVADRKSKLSTYCGSLANGTLKGMCYQYLFHFLYILGTPIERTHSLCEAGNTFCEDGYKNYKLDSWETIRSI